MIEIRILQALAHHAQAERGQAFMMLEQALRLAAPEGYVRVFVDEGAPMATLLAGALEALTWPQGERAQDGRAYAEHLLAVLRAEGVEPVRDVHSPGSDRQIATASSELLTEREQEVLRLLAAGRSNQAIADELVVAVGTVKRHLNNIFGKLGVQTRLEAAARARDLSLV